MAIVNQMLLQNYAAALNQIDTLETGVKKAVEDFKALKAGELSIEQLVVTDNGWEFVPAPPFQAEPQDAKSNGVKPKGAVTE